MTATLSPARVRQALSGQRPELTHAEQAALEHLATLTRPGLRSEDRIVLDRLVGPIDEVAAAWGRPARAAAARNLLLAAVHQRQLAYWAWDEGAWLELASDPRPAAAHARLQLVALGYLLGGHYRLHHRVGIVRLRCLADVVFGHGAVEPALAEVRATLLAWKASEHVLSWEVINATVDLLLACGSPRLEDVTQPRLLEAVAEHRAGSSRRKGLFKVSRVLADKGVIARPLTSNHHHRGPKPETLATVPPEWLSWAQRWRKLASHEPGTIRSMFSVILIAGRWAADTHPDAIPPDAWTRDMAAEYVADTMHATVGQWAGHNRNTARFGQPISATGMANRIDSLRGFFCDLIEWEWITHGSIRAG